MAYKQAFTQAFLKDMKSIKKDRFLLRRADRKIEEIIQNPDRYKPLKGAMKGLRRAHVDPYVLVFEIKDESVIFHAFKHHDYACD
jgi:YafQ family addiction module toxin component